MGNEWSLHSLQPKFPPAEGSWGYPGTPEVLQKKSWGLEKRKRNSILSLKPACLHPWLSSFYFFYFGFFACFFYTFKKFEIYIIIYHSLLFL